MRGIKRILIFILIIILCIATLGCSNKNDTIKIATKPMTE